MLNRHRREVPSVTRPLHLLRRLVSDRRGATAIVIGIGMAGFIGFAGLGTEVGLWYLIKRTMHGAADSAAFSAAIAEAAGEAYITEAKSTTAKYGFVDQQNGVTVAVNKPPKSGNYTGTANAIEVVIKRPQSRMFSALFLSANPTIVGRAVAIPGSGDDCVLALDKTASGSITNTGTTSVDLVKCGMADNSNNGTAFSLSGGATVTADSVSVVGGISESNGATLDTVSSPPVSGASPVTDPYASLAIPSYSGCNQTTSGPIHGNVGPWDAGGGTYVICGDLKINSNGGSGSSLTLQNGVFIVDGGSVTVDSASTLTLINATLILTSSTGKNYGTVSIAGGATVNATAPTSGTTAGIAFYTDRNAPSATDKFNGGSSQNITGAIYMPTQTVLYTGGVATGSGCTQIIGDQVDFSGNSAVESNCTGKGTKTIASAPKLVE